MTRRTYQTYARRYGAVITYLAQCPTHCVEAYTAAALALGFWVIIAFGAGVLCERKWGRKR